MKKYDFFDGLFILGNPYMSKGLTPKDALVQLERANIKNAVIKTKELAYCSPDMAVSNMSKVLESYESFYGLYPMLPDITNDLPAISEVVVSSEFSRYAGFILQPDVYNIPKQPIFLKEYFEVAAKRHIPVWFNMGVEKDYIYIADVLQEYPMLYTVLYFDDEWPNTRKVYPLLKEFKNTHLLTCNMIWMGAYEDFYNRFGAERLLFATRAPEKYIGAAILDLLSADIPENAKRMIAGENLKRLMGGIIRD
ncbi:MAG TPA: hypothetical protein VFD25_01855 [Clostridia bacterium]|nr:hypothetical protein [Clostridia bacterium]